MRVVACGTEKPAVRHMGVVSNSIHLFHVNENRGFAHSILFRDPVAKG